MSYKLRIELPRTNYLAGDLVNGKLVFETSAAKDVNGIHVHFFGYEFVEFGLWSEVPLKKRWILDGSATLYGNKQNNKKTPSVAISGSDKEATKLTINPGKHIFPFCFRLPRSIPPSAEFRDGKIRVEYALNAFLTLPSGSKSLSCKEVIKIGALFDHRANVKTSVTKQKTFWLHSSSSSQKPTLNMNASLESSPIAHPGEKVDIRLVINNHSARHVQNIKIKLKRHITYGTSKEKQTVMKLKHFDAKFPLNLGYWSSNIRLALPDTLNLKPTVETAHLFKVEYYISIRAKLGSTHTLTLRLPLFIGNHKPPEEPEQVEERKDIKFDWDVLPTTATNLPDPLYPGNASAPNASTPNAPELYNPFKDPNMRPELSQYINFLASLDAQVEQELASDQSDLNLLVQHYVVSIIALIDTAHNMRDTAVNEEPWGKFISACDDALRGFTDLTTNHRKLLSTVCRDDEGLKQTLIKRLRSIISAGHHLYPAAREVLQEPSEDNRAILESIVENVEEHARHLINEMIIQGFQFSNPQEISFQHGQSASKHQWDNHIQQLLQQAYLFQQQQATQNKDVQYEQAQKQVQEQPQQRKTELQQALDLIDSSVAVFKNPFQDTSDEVSSDPKQLNRALLELLQTIELSNFNNKTTEMDIAKKAERMLAIAKNVFTTNPSYEPIISTGAVTVANTLKSLLEQPNQEKSSARTVITNWSTQIGRQIQREQMKLEKERTPSNMESVDEAIKKLNCSINKLVNAGTSVPHTAPSAKTDQELESL